MADVYYNITLKDIRNKIYERESEFAYIVREGRIVDIELDIDNHSNERYVDITFFMNETTRGYLVDINEILKEKLCQKKLIE